nr:tigger transposable element-derived protein 4-like [Rhipicephalus microplus]
MCGETGAVNDSVVAVYRDGKLQSLLQQFPPNHISTCDEAGLFIKLLPEKTLAFAGDPCHCGKHSKERLTVLVGSNLSGSEKLLLLVIGKSKHPRCFKKAVTLPVLYEANKKAWDAETAVSPQMDSVCDKLPPADVAFDGLGAASVSISAGISFEGLADADKDVELCADLTDDEIIRQVTEDSDGTDNKEPSPTQPATRSELTLGAAGVSISAGITFEGFADADKDFELCTDLTDYEIIRQVTEDSDDTENEEPSPTQPTSSKLTRALMTLSSVYSGNMTLTEIEADVIAGTQNVVEKKIGDFFAPKC